MDDDSLQQRIDFGMDAWQQVELGDPCGGSWGFFSFSDAPAAAGGGIGMFAWFPSRTDMLLFIQTTLPVCPAESRFVSASFVDDADGFVAAFGSLTEWKHVDRAGNDLTGVAPIAEGTDRLSAGLSPLRFVDDADGFVAAFGSLTEWKHVDRAGNDLTGVAPIAEGTARLRAGLCPLRSLTTRTGSWRHSVR